MRIHSRLYYKRRFPQIKWLCSLFLVHLLVRLSPFFPIRRFLHFIRKTQRTTDRRPYKKGAKTTVQKYDHHKKEGKAHQALSSHLFSTSHSPDTKLQSAHRRHFKPNQKKNELHRHRRKSDLLGTGALLSLHPFPLIYYPPPPLLILVRPVGFDILAGRARVSD